MRDLDWSDVEADAARMALAAGDAPEYEPEEDPAYLAWLEAEEKRGELAFAPDTLGCYECGGFDGQTAPERAVVKLGPVLAQSFDPTQSYVLECGHTAI